MKKSLNILLFLLCIFLLNGCSDKEIDPQNVTVSFEYQNSTIAKNAEDGTVLLEYIYQKPLFTIKGASTDTAEALNAAYENYYSSAMESLIEIYLKSAADEYEALSENEKSNWNNYIFQIDCRVQRCDGFYVSMAHSMTFSQRNNNEQNSLYKTGVTFSTLTAERITLNNIFTNYTDALDYIPQFLETELKNRNDFESLPENYTDFLEYVLSEETWYLTPIGFTIICNEGTLGTQELGILEFTLAYENTYLLTEQ